MGLDIGFTDESLAKSRYAHCAPFRRQTSAVYAPPKEGQPDELAQYRETREFLNLSRMRMESPELYQAATGQARFLPFQDMVPWSPDTQSRFESDMLSQVQGYVETRANEWVKLTNVPQQLRKKLLKGAGKDHRLSAWYAMPFVEQIGSYCKGCPIRPPNEDNCYLRFSSYPGMNDFREGFLLAILFATTIDQERLKNSWFSFPHLDRQKEQLPKDKIEELYAMIEGTEPNKGAERWFNQVVEALQLAIPGDAETNAEAISLGDAPFADEFASAFLYRDVPYTPEDARKYLPYFETLREVGDWAIWDANNAEVRHRLINFRERMSTLVTALQFGDKYGVETFVSY